LPNEAGGDEAVGSLAASIKLVPAEKDILSSPEDDSSLDETSCGEECNIPSKLPVDSQLPQWHTLSRWLKKKGDTRKKLHLLERQFKGMSFGADRMPPPSSPIKSHGRLPRRYQGHILEPQEQPTNLEDNQGDAVAREGDAGGNDALNPPPPAVAVPHTQPSAMAAPMCQGEAMTQMMGMSTWRTTTPMNQVRMPPTRVTLKIPNRWGWASFTRP
jgi:hypothetical protein